jgi:hypothetical protein
MALNVVHLRWNDVDPEQYEELCRALPDGAQRPDGCLSRQRRRQGTAVLATEVWIDEQQASAFLTALPELLGPAGLGDPQRAVFAVADCFAAGYGVYPARTRTATTAPVLPTPRESDEVSLLSASATSAPVAEEAL